jgi:hypothetical protein
MPTILSNAVKIKSAKINGVKNTGVGLMDVWLLRDIYDKPISNFQPELSAVIYKYGEDEAEPEIWLELKMLLWNGRYSDEFLEPLLGLGNVKWLNKDKRARIHPDFSRGTAARYFEDIIRQELPKLTPKKLYVISRLGLHLIDGIPIFCVGDRIICPPGTEKLNIEIKPMPYRLDIDPNMTEAEAAALMLDFIAISSDALPVMLSQVLLYIMRHVYQSIGKTPCVIVFVYGETGTKKPQHPVSLRKFTTALKVSTNPKD